MSVGICRIAVTPMRAEASHRAEMVSQLLFGEACEILHEAGDWLQVRGLYDDYEGYVDVKALAIVGDNDDAAFDAFTADVCNLLIADDGPHILPLGTPVPSMARGFAMGKQLENNYVYEGEYFLPENVNVVETAHMFLNTPYLWGGKSSFGIDCSGFVQQVYKLHGVKLPRDAWQQAAHGEVLSFLEEGVAGDLVFFDNEEGKITHVGMLLEDRQIIHAHGKVRIDVLDHGGIFNRETKKHTHKLRFLRHISQ
ncbi:MAG: C40 family peptidase [Weeksellaceae bacterium]|nr:C40 family peptidase [Weeksellaceae bacterium]